ncbi:LPXTG cell wall anchor domain-containing protein [Micromonospora inyonensis]|uniref:LPXTG-motif cell wall anchor domain-containing protein n=1 Tax=Micromonospora inyonensis TaxID=47866 RepID=A0A1C6RG91_9ACTN|nr:LPXTG cell wall anchor domain-containing protein [Micromonospora inyonensis]SCL16183.1 LPXTG-motif cell wall anchor domain-containing protein [Micromonospora inyonensis]
MLNPHARRLLAGLGVVAALVATPASPASADLSDVKIDFYFPDVTATVLVNAAGGGGGGTGDGDGGLPVTGVQTGLIVGVGGLLLALGVGGFVLSRRRRTRFVA